MFYIFLTLTTLSAIILIAGFIWMIASSGQMQHRIDNQVGTDLIADQMADEDDEATISTTRTVFKGSAQETSIEASYSFRDIKDRLVTGHWRQALPVLLTAGGLSGLLFFGSLALFLGLKDKWIGGLMLVLVIYSLVRTLIGFLRA